jgi:hypothetical protein
MATKYAKWKSIHQIALQFTNIFHCETLQNLPNWEFWLENMYSIWQPWLELLCVNERDAITDTFLQSWITEAFKNLIIFVYFVKTL